MDFKQEDFFPMLEKLLSDNVDKIPILGLDNLQQVIPHQIDPVSLFDVSILGDVSRLAFKRDFSTGQLLGLEEEPIKAGDDFHYDLTSKSSVSMRRCAASDKSITGSVANIPFRSPALEITNTPKVNKADEPQFAEFLSNELSRKENELPGTGLKHVFPTEDPLLELYNLNDIQDSNDDLENWVENESKQYDSLNAILHSSIDVDQPSSSKLATDSKPKDAAMEKEVQKLVSSVVDAKITETSLVKEKSNEFAKVINIANDPAEEIINPAKTYDFKLDPFQKQAIIHMEKFCNVFVAAHTSAGKTVVAEYAIAMSRRSMTKVVYTSPIKALSNQKYRDFSLEFGDVGLITGDVQVNPDASCLILTTEILLQMLDNGSDLIRDLEWAIFDEVHYVNDEERGHVWERIFIMLPEHVNLVLLSATVPNVIKFAEWLGRIRKKPTVVITTARRPVPLEHYLYTGSNPKTIDQRYKFIDKESNFVNHGYVLALESKKEKPKHLRGAKGEMPNASFHQEKNIYITLVRHLEKLSLLPVICFTFSRKRCDSNARMLQSLDLTTAEEKSRIHKFVTRSLDRFKESDRKLRQVRNIKEMLKRGFGVHHSGVLPLLKEITEILFCDGLVKVLFATETFAMGVNMPARCVVFDSIKKHDGKKRRFLIPSEYIQMAGRAGRRGKDAIGTVIVLCKNEIPEASDLTAIALGQATPLESKFQLKYSMILTLLRARHHLRVESVIGKSFIEHDRQSSATQNQDQQKTLLKQVSSFRQPDCDSCLQGKMDEFCEFYINFMSDDDYNRMRDYIFQKAMVSNKHIVYGRTLLVIGGLENNPAALGVLVQVFKDSIPPKLDVLYLKDYNSGKVEYRTIDYQNVLLILKEKINGNWIEIFREKDILNRGKSITKVAQQMRNYMQTLVSPLSLLSAPHLDPCNDLKCKELEFHIAHDRYQMGFRTLSSYECWMCPQFIVHFGSFFRKHLNIQRLNYIDKLLSPESLRFLPEYKMKLKVLRELNYINDENVPELKAKVACLMSVHELIITEMLTENLLSDCTPPEIAALLSIFVYQGKKTEDEVDQCDKPPKTKLEKKCEAIINIARNIGNIQKTHGLDQCVEDFVDTLKFGLVEVVHDWALGKCFNDILKMTDEQEGIIVRCIQRLDEVLRAVKAACKLIGYPDIGEKIEIANQSINRDIVFAASLYVSASQDELEEREIELINEEPQEQSSE